MELDLAARAASARASRRAAPRTARRGGTARGASRRARRGCRPARRGRPNANSSTQAAVLRPTPGRAVRYARASSTGSSARKSGPAGPAARAGSPGSARTSGGAGRRAGSRPRPPPAARRGPPPSGEARAQAQVRDVAVAVVGRLREDGQDQLLEPLAVRRGDGPAVDEPQPVADRAHPPRRGRRPRGARHGGDLGAHRKQPMHGESPRRRGAARLASVPRRERSHMGAYSGSGARWGHRGAR